MEDDMGRACSTHGEEKSIQEFGRETTGNIYTQDKVEIVPVLN
jgi:hypothetical protein